MVTAPEMSRASTWRITISWNRRSRSEDSPTSSGLAVGSEAAASGNTIAGRINSRTISALSSLSDFLAAQALVAVRVGDDLALRVEEHRSALLPGVGGPLGNLVVAGVELRGKTAQARLIFRTARAPGEPSCVTWSNLNGCSAAWSENGSHRSCRAAEPDYSPQAGFDPVMRGRPPGRLTPAA